MLGSTTHNRWEPGIGDPSFIGWFTFSCYMLCALLCAVQFHRCRRNRRFGSRDALLWMGLAVLLFLLGINKQLDLQTWFTHFGRDLAKSQGWYDQRRLVQKWFIVGVASSGLLELGLLVWVFRGCWRDNVLALVGISFLICFVIIRAASFHHVDEFLGWHGLSIPMNAVLELGGIGCIMLAALRNLRRECNSNHDISAVI